MPSYIPRDKIAPYLESRCDLIYVAVLCDLGRRDPGGSVTKDTVAVSYDRLLAN